MSSKKDRYVLRFAWFNEEQWRSLCALVPDRAELDASYEQWQQSALRAVGEIQTSGHTVERVFVDVSAMAHWCHERNLRLSGSSRAEYVAQLVLGPRSGDA